MLTLRETKRIYLGSSIETIGIGRKSLTVLKNLNDNAIAGYIAKMVIIYSQCNMTICQKCL